MEGKHCYNFIDQNFESGPMKVPLIIILYNTTQDTSNRNQDSSNLHLLLNSPDKNHDCPK